MPEQIPPVPDEVREEIDQAVDATVGALMEALTETLPAEYLPYAKNRIIEQVNR